MGACQRRQKRRRLGGVAAVDSGGGSIGGRRVDAPFAASVTIIEMTLSVSAALWKLFIPSVCRPFTRCTNESICALYSSPRR